MWAPVRFQDFTGTNTTDQYTHNIIQIQLLPIPGWTTMVSPKWFLSKSRGSLSSSRYDTAGFACIHNWICLHWQLVFSYVHSMFWNGNRICLIFYAANNAGFKKRKIDLLHLKMAFFAVPIKLHIWPFLLLGGPVPRHAGGHPRHHGCRVVSAVWSANIGKQKNWGGAVQNLVIVFNRNLT